MRGNGMVLAYKKAKDFQRPGKSAGGGVVKFFNAARDHLKFTKESLHKPHSERRKGGANDEGIS
jgi:hypothetical protein